MSDKPPPVRRRSTTPLLALVAGVVLLALEWRGGASFWSVFALLLIAFAGAVLVLGTDER
jgi:hypothetical protein